MRIYCWQIKEGDRGEQGKNHTPLLFFVSWLGGQSTGIEYFTKERDEAQREAEEWEWGIL